MSFRLDKIFNTFTASPFQQNSYIEIEPCEALKPYIRCFWGSRASTAVIPPQNSSLVIPDICMDIILTENNTEIYDCFCGINNNSFTSRNNAPLLFGIRFYAWSVPLFSDENMNGTLNAFYDANAYFKDFNDSLKAEIMSCGSIYERKRIAEKYLISKLNQSRENCDVMNSLFLIINYKGRATVSDLSDYCIISKRQLEQRIVWYVTI